MIVIEVNVLACLLVPGKFTASAEQLLVADAAWAAPLLWRSELRNILAACLPDALQLFQRGRTHRLRRVRCRHNGCPATEQAKQMLSVRL